MGIFKRRKVEEKKIPKVDLIVFEQLTTDEDKHIVDLASRVLDGHPLIINFQEIDVDGANKAISFLSGVVFAIDGEIYKIDEKNKIFLFASSDVYDDGTMREFLKTLE